ncbi:MAG: sugar transferase [Chloroflexota bacterium]
MQNTPVTMSSLFSAPGLYARFENCVADFAKRLLDVIAAALGLLLLSPLFLALGILIKRDSPGPVFYWGRRVGRHGREFRILKFRTMREEPASYAGPPITGRDDPRITPLGQWLRDTKLNELPQLWNVLMGEMSLVGPRPEAPEIVRTWSPAVREEILSVRPGITSPASVLYRDEEKRLSSGRVIDDYLENILPDKLRLDQLYVRHHSLLTDLDTLFWTFVVLIPRLGSRHISEGWLFGGPLTRLSRRYLNWLVTDFVISLFGIGLTGFLWRLSGPLDIGLDRAVSLAIVLAFLFSLFNTLLGLRAVSWAHLAADDVLRLFVSCALVTVTVIGIELVYHPHIFPPVRFMSAAGLVVLFGFIAVRYRLRLVTGLASRWITIRNSTFGAPERVLVVGAGEGSEFATWLLQRREFKRIYQIVGIVDDDPSKHGMRYEGLKVLGTTNDIPELVKRHDVGVIFHAVTSPVEEDQKRILALCRKTGLRVVMLSEVLDLLRRQLTKPAPAADESSHAALALQAAEEKAFV